MAICSQSFKRCTGNGSKVLLQVIGQQKGVPMRVLRSRETVQQMREARAEAQLMESDRQASLQQAETAAKVLPALQSAGAV